MGMLEEAGCPIQSVAASRYLVLLLVLGAQTLCLPSPAQVLDSFNPGPIGSAYSVTLQSDGRILLGGHFLQSPNTPAGGLLRFNADGNADSDFETYANLGFEGVAVLTNKQILAASGIVRRFNSDGSLDSAFVSAPGTRILVQPDGKILSHSSALIRLNNDGSLDTNFSANVPSLFAMALQTDGKIVVGGAFTSIDGQPRNYLARLDSQGGLDTNFNPNVGFPVYAIAVPQ